MAQARGPIGGRRFAGARLHRSGHDAQRVLLVGDRSFVDGQDGLPTRFVEAVADRIAARTGRGLDLDLVWDLAPALQAVVAATQAWRLWRYEAVVVLVREEQVQRFGGWRSARMARVASRLIAELADSSEMLVVRLHPDDGTAAPQDPADTVPSVTVGLDDDDGILDLPGSAALVADRVARLLAATGARATRGTGGTAAERRREPESEADRQRAVDRTREALGGLTPDLERVVLMARNTFDVPFAQVNLLDHGRIRTLAFVGAPGDAAEQPICTITVRGGGPTIIADTWQDHRLDANPHVHDARNPVRFYAAHPIESMDGYRVGTLCVFDFKPHDPEEIDPSVLRDLALLAEAEISTLP